VGATATTADATRHLSRTTVLVLLVFVSVGCATSDADDGKVKRPRATVPQSTVVQGEATVGYATYCAGADDCPPDGVPSSLRRPLEVPKLSVGTPCPVSDSREISPAFAPGLGPGPVYPVGLGADATLPFEYPPAPNSQFAGSEWGGEKTLWIADPDYTGPILIRGRQVDGPSEVRFDVGAGKPLDELQLPPDYAADYSGGWRNFPSHTRLRTAGCYAYQVDGDGFSIVIVFRAEATSPPPEALTTSGTLELEEGLSSATFSLLAPDPPRHSFDVQADIAPADGEIAVDIETWYGETLHVLRPGDRSSCHVGTKSARCAVALPALEAQRGGPWTVVARKRSIAPATARVRVTFEPISR
jgi:hypothetical protein